MRKVKYYKCPECGKKFKTLGGWGDHIQTMHPTTIPEGFTISRYFYFTLTGKTAGRCIMCHGDTLWNEATGKYDRYCTNPKCKQEYVKIAKKRMRDKYGKEHILNDPEMQRKMLASKKISGEYAFSDGSGKLGYVGTYEKDFLMMMDKFMHYSATDIMAPSPHTYYYEYENEKHFYIPDFYVPNLNLEIEIKAQDNTHPKIQAIDKVKERLKDEMMTKNPKINYLKINDKNYNNFFEYLLSLKEQVDDKDLTKEVKSSAEFKAATESFFNYYENDEAMEFVSLTKEEPKTSGTNPVVIVFSSKVNPILQAVGFNTRDRFSEFGICLSNPSDPIGYDYYALTPVSENLYPGGPIAMFFKKTLSIYIERVIGWDNPCMSFVTYVDDSTYEALKNRLNNHKPFTFNFNSDIITWFSHSDRYRFFCHKMINLVTEKEFESRDYILLTIANNAREFIEDMKNKLSILANSPMGPARERQAFEEHVMEEFYGTLPEEYEQALEGAFTGWEDIEIEEPALEEGYEYNIDIEPATESIKLKTNFNRVKVKGTLSLQKFTRTELTQEVLDKYKEKCPSFGHCRISNMSKGYLYTDKSDEIVGFVNVVRKQDNIKWIQALNIQPKYQGYGLYEQIMKVAVRELGGTDIETPPKNDTAKLVYKKFGFRTYTNEPTSHAMSIRSDAKREKYSGRAKPNAKTMTESGLTPVYIMLSDTKTTFGNVVKFFTQAPYSHASISFDASMTKLYSFASRDGHTMIPLGFAEESVASFVKLSPKSKYVLYVKLVDSKDLSKMKSTLKQFTKNKSSFRYDVAGAVKAFMGKHNANEKKYFCSGFVAYILNSGKSQVTENDSDLTKPMDIADIKNIHLVDMGLCKDYNQAYVEKKTKQIFEKHYMHKEKDSHHQPIDEEAELEESKAKEKESEDKE